MERLPPSRWLDTTPIPMRQYVLFEEDLAVAYATTFRQTVFAAQQPLPIVALQRVAAAPDHRRHGFGSAVVRAAFREAEEDGHASCLLGTEIPGFYRRLGAIDATNRFEYRAGTKRRRMKVWTGLMRHPPDRPWPSGTIDVRRPPW